MVVNRLPDLLRQPLLAGVNPAHGALQLGELAHQLGGQVESGHHREFGRAVLDVKADSALFRDVWKPGERHQVWMSHGDRVTKLPPGFSVIATSENAPFAAIADEARRYYAVQFHPDRVTATGAERLLRIAMFKAYWDELRRIEKG